MPRLFIVRYKRNSTEENTEVKKNPRNMWDALLNEDADPAAQLVARYNGSNEIPEVGISFCCGGIVSHIVTP